MDDIDRKILGSIQSDFPLSKRPYGDLSEQLGLSEEEIFGRVERLKKEGIIRRIGGSFDSRCLGFSTTLCAAKVPETRVALFVEEVNKYPGVTHNYLREHAYNVWFTLVVTDRKEVDRLIGEIIQSTGVRDVINLPAKRTFKVLVDFELT
ncbi:MAG: AsnC family transcriptional regulator [Deltaproteobacteria bacterium]|nr:AsnC family transcriptional regulator [Deltaproteobacteria bacterium]MBW2077665.1 AsnC family transcriptional regulator [Deltaproteobacteria bacterium]MBW2312116.1 AsnC family transcriptional regulator [Deltaproteobacteria bacterium]